MDLTRPKLIWALAAALAVAGILVAGYMSGVVDGGSAGEPSAAASESGGYDEGIEVHGDWVIEVRNTDGSLAERREFENALTAAGQRFLANVLARSYFVGKWAIWAYDGGGQSPCTGNLFCQIDEPNTGPGLAAYNTSHFPTLTVTTDPAPCCNGDTMVLQGNFDAEIDGLISVVSSLLCYTYPANPDPATCNNSQEFTLKGFAPLAITAGQQVLVTVRISFS